MGKKIIVKDADFSENCIGSVNSELGDIILSITWLSEIGSNSQVSYESPNFVIGHASTATERYAGRIDVTKYQGKTLRMYCAPNIYASFPDVAFASDMISTFNSKLSVIEEVELDCEDGVMTTYDLTIPTIVSGSVYFYFTHKVASSGYSRDYVTASILNDIN